MGLQNNKIADTNSNIQILQEEINILKRSMDKPFQDFINATKDTLSSWYEEETKNTVKLQWELSSQFGPVRMLQFKEQLLQFSCEMRREAGIALSSPSHWSHLNDTKSIPSRILCHVDYYKVNDLSGCHPLSNAIAILCGKLGCFLAKFKFIDSKDYYKADKSGNAGYTIYAGPFVFSNRMRIALLLYSDLHIKLLEKNEKLIQLQNELAQSQMEIQWENAHEIAQENLIDWKKAWKRAKKYEKNDLRWCNKYADWLLAGNIKSNVSFKRFLLATNNVENFASDIKRLWRTGLTKDLMTGLLQKSQAAALQLTFYDESVHYVCRP